jgi:hypothetical protein
MNAAQVEVQVQPAPASWQERCSWCGATPASCIACVECLEMFCSQACHVEYLEQESADLRRQNACREAFQAGSRPN